MTLLEVAEVVGSPNPYFLGFHFPTLTIGGKRLVIFQTSPNPYFLGFHFPTIKNIQKFKEEMYHVLILIFLDFIFLQKNLTRLKIKFVFQCPNPYFLGFHFPTQSNPKRTNQSLCESPNPYFLGFHFPTHEGSISHGYRVTRSPNPYFLGFHFPTHLKNNW